MGWGALSSTWWRYHRGAIWRAIPLLILSILPFARADLVPAVTFPTPGSDSQNDFTWSLGYEFYLTEAVSLHALGYYDAGADGLNEVHAVGLWTIAGELLASATVTSDDPLDQWFRWHTISPINLAAESSYVIAGFTSIDEYMGNPEELQTDSRIYFYCARYVFGSELAMPEECFSEYLGFFGPNLMISDELVGEPIPVSAPNALSLFILGGLVIMALYLPRIIQNSQKADANKAFYLLLLLISINSTAKALELEVQPVQGPASWSGQMPLGSRYERYNHENVGAILQYDNVFDALGNYIVPVGETLRWVWMRDGLQLSSIQFSYVGGSEHCWATSTGHQFCGTFYRFLSFDRFVCRPETGRYAVRVLRNGTEVARHNFDTERFRMKTEPEMWRYPADFRPKTIARVENGQQKPLTFRVTDDLGCGAGLKDVDVVVQSFVVPDTNSHSHFNREREGTGEFVASGGHPIALSIANTRAEGKTNGAGILALDYKAKDYALEERVTVKFRRPARDGHAEQRVDGAFGWTIKAGDYVEGNLFPHLWDQNDLCHHENQARSLRNGLHAPLLAGFTSFSLMTGGELLHINDASFPMGGAVDTKDASCGSHDTHRIGIDIDIGSETVSGKRLKTFSYEIIPGFASKSLILILNERMFAQGFGRDCRSRGIHYRYGNSTEPRVCL